MRFVVWTLATIVGGCVLVLVALIGGLSYSHHVGYNSGNGALFPLIALFATAFLSWSFYPGHKTDVSP